MFATAYIDFTNIGQVCTQTRVTININGVLYSAGNIRNGYKSLFAFIINFFYRFDVFCFCILSC